MKLKDNKFFKLPRFLGGWYGGLDRLFIPHDNLFLKGVFQREDNGEIELIAKAKDGPEEKRGHVNFTNKDEKRSNKDILYHWLRKQIGKDIQAIYHSEFDFEN